MGGTCPEHDVETQRVYDHARGRFVVECPRCVLEAHRARIRAVDEGR